MSEETMERWCIAYQQMAEDAQQLGIPRAVIPALPPDPTVPQLRSARDLLQAMIGSFLSSGL